MNDLKHFVIVAPDGSRVSVTLDGDLLLSGRAAAPDWILQEVGLPRGKAQLWRLIRSDADDESGARQSGSRSVQNLCLARAIVAAAVKAPFDPRQARLRAERERLEKLNKESDYVRAEPLNVLPGSEPEHYRVTFLCRGITGIDAERKPIYGDRHQVEIYCDEEFPSDVPRLRWVTPIWHPNIQHSEPKGVCVNKAEWLGGMGLDDLVRLMFEMVQYKNYHAHFTPPYPLDMDVAKWVVEYAERHNVVNKTRRLSVDDKPFTRPTVPQKISVTPVAAPPSGARIRIVPPTATPPSKTKIKVVGPSSSSEKKPEDRPVSPRIKVVKP